MRKPFCEFLHTFGVFDYDEWHAICLGFLMPWFGWYLIVRYGASSESSRLLSSETWYVALGMTLRNLALFALAVGTAVILKAKGVF